MYTYCIQYTVHILYTLDERVASDTYSINLYSIAHKGKEETKTNMFYLKTYQSLYIYICRSFFDFSISFSIILYIF